MILANIINIITKESPLIALDKKAPKTDPNIVPKNQFFTISISIFFNLKWENIEDIEVKIITPKEDATDMCMITSEETPNDFKI